MIAVIFTIDDAVKKHKQTDTGTPIDKNPIKTGIIVQLQNGDNTPKNVANPNPPMLFKDESLDWNLSILT